MFRTSPLVFMYCTGPVIAETACQRPEQTRLLPKSRTMSLTRIKIDATNDVADEIEAVKKYTSIKDSEANYRR